MTVDDEWIQLCKDEMEAIGDESRPAEVRQAEMDRRRAELYREHLDAAGIEIRRKA